MKSLKLYLVAPVLLPVLLLAVLLITGCKKEGKPHWYGLPEAPSAVAHCNNDDNDHWVCIAGGAKYECIGELGGDKTCALITVTPCVESNK